MSFADEVKQMKSADVPAAPVVAASETPAAAAPVVEQGLAMPNHGDVWDPAFDLPAGNAPVVPVPEAPAAEAIAPAAEVTEEPPKAAKIRIGTREFQTPEEAIAYATELERGRAEDQAYIEGVKAASKAPAEAPKPAVKSPYEVFSEKVFEDPVAAAKEFSEAIKNELRTEYQQTEAQKIANAQAEVAKAQMWDGFYKTNTDLSTPETRELVQNYYLPTALKNGDLKPTSTTEELANYVRAKLKISKQAALPTKELPSKAAIMPGASGEATVQATSAAPQENSGDFISQLRTLRKKAK